jgi:hypothetical protein
MSRQPLALPQELASLYRLDIPKKLVLRQAHTILARRVLSMVTLLLGIR